MEVDKVIVLAIATDNLVSRNGARYPLAELPALAKYLVDKPASIDHAWTTVEKEWGTIVAAEVVKATPSPDLDEYNQAIVKSEGYSQVHVEIACPDDSPHLKEFDMGLRIRVSITAAYTTIRCPGCSCGEDVWSRECVNDFWELPYYERHGVCDAMELSLVTIPAVKAARVLVPIQEPVK
jgi:hypothetical protein